MEAILSVILGDMGFREGGNRIPSVDSDMHELCITL